MSIKTEAWETLHKTTQGQEEMIRRMVGQDRMAWLESLSQTARHQVTYAINSFSAYEREELLGGGGVTY